MTIQQIADAAGVTDRTVRRWISLEDIPVFVRGDQRRRLIDRADVEHLFTPRPIQRGADRVKVH